MLHIVVRILVYQTDRLSICSLSSTWLWSMVLHLPTWSEAFAEMLKQLHTVVWTICYGYIDFNSTSVSLFVANRLYCDTVSSYVQWRERLLLIILISFVSFRVVIGHKPMTNYFSPDLCCISIHCSAAVCTNKLAITLRKLFSSVAMTALISVKVRKLHGL